MQENIRLFFYGILVIMAGMTSPSICAQELGYTGVSPINSSFGGASASVPLDASGAIYWNPATIGMLELGEAQFSFGRTNAPWYGDESLAGAVIVPAVTVGVLYLLSLSDDDDDSWDDDTNYQHDDDEKEEPPPSELESVHEIYLPTIRGFNFTYVTAPSDASAWNYGISLTEIGTRKQTFVLDETSKNIVGMAFYRVKNIELVPSVSWRNKRKNFSLGVSGIFSIDEHPNASLPHIPNTRFLGDERGHCGVGLQVGAYYKVKKHFSFGVSARLPQWTAVNTYRWYSFDTQEVRTRKMIFSQDSPLRIVLGASYTESKNLIIATDVRYYDFQHVRALYDVSGNRSNRNVLSLGTGAQYRFSDGFSVRLGYQYSDAGYSLEDTLFNTTLPIQSGHSIHYGFSFGTDHWDVSFAVSHSLGGKKTTLATIGGDSLTFDRNPNTSNFWWGARFRF